tara:strand:- start:172 stop:900 length:729 start_codon:yes stop_codon:yes gene_type:complete
VKLNLVIASVSRKQKSVERTIEKILTKTDQLESKFAKFNLYIKALEPDTEPEKQGHVSFEDGSLIDQLELDISAKNEKSSIGRSKDYFLNWDLLLKALHFPNDKNDAVGFEALNLARQNNSVLQLLRVSEDFLNLLAQDGIYLDDLNIEAPPVEAWLNFVNTDKKLSAKRLSCIGIEGYIKKLKIRVKADTVFRDTALTLFRRFDKLLRDKIGTAKDYQIFQLATTRSGKAFLIVGKISDIF